MHKGTFFSDNFFLEKNDILNILTFCKNPQVLDLYSVKTIFRKEAKMTLTVKEYAEKRRLTVTPIYKKINNHKSELKGHMRKIRGRLELDEVAVMILDGEYPNEFYKKKNQDFEIRELEEEIRFLKKELEKKNKDLEDVKSDKRFYQAVFEKERKACKEKDKEIEELKNKLWKYEGTFIRRLFC